MKSGVPNLRTNAMDTALSLSLQIQMMSRYRCYISGTCTRPSPSSCQPSLNQLSHRTGSAPNLKHTNFSNYSKRIIFYSFSFWIN